jgi:hypothetical protein
MRTHRSFLAAVILSLAAAGCAPDARAEIAVETDYAGEYVRTVVVTRATVRSLRIWSVQRTLSSSNVLNPGGDVNGDLWPTIAENPFDSNHPWAVWSRFGGAGYDLAWGRWLPGGWTAPVEVQPGGGADDGDDLDPRIAFGPFGRPYLAWWRDEGGTGRVYFSMYGDGGWMPGAPVSDPGIDSRYPSISILDDGRIRVEFETPGGRVIRFVFVPVQNSITDDIDPIAPKGYVPPVTAR